MHLPPCWCDYCVGVVHVVEVLLETDTVNVIYQRLSVCLSVCLGLSAKGQSA